MMNAEVPDLTLLEGTVAPKIIDAAQAASNALHKAGVRHALIGGLAVAAYGYIRATKDVDFLVGSEGFTTHGGGVVTMNPGVPFSVNGIAVDVLMQDRPLPGRELVDLRDDTESIPIVDPEVLFYLKLRAFRRQDQLDMIKLLQCGLPEKPILKFLKTVAPDLLDKFDQIREAAGE